MVPKRIDSITTIEDLQMYACSKVRNTKDWAMKCVDCNKCPVGKKAEELLEKETAPVSEPVKETAYTRVEEALKHEDPAQWLVDKGYYIHKKSAHEAIRRFKLGLLSKDGYSKFTGLDKGPKSMMDKSRQNVIDIFEGIKTFDEAMVSYLSKQDPSRKISSIFSKLYDWKKKYPDLSEKYPFMPAIARYLTKREFKNLTVSELLEKFASQDDDEVSVEDFLQENEPDKLTPEEKFKRGLTMTPAEIAVVQNESALLTPEDFKPTIGEKLDKAATDAHVELQPTPEQVVIRDEFGKKRRELLARANEISRKIEDLTNEAEDIMSQINMLDAVASMFGMKPVNKAESA